MVKYERGASCGKGNHSYVDHGSYEKCSVCGSSRTKNGYTGARESARRYARARAGFDEEYVRRSREERERARRDRLYEWLNAHAGPDPYEVLGVPRSATDDEVKSAYRRMAREYHPDVTAHDKTEAAEKFRQATEAYERIQARRASV